MDRQVKQMSFKGFIKTNYFRFIYINVLSILAGVGAIGGGYVQMYWLTYVKDHNWSGVLWTVLILGIFYIFAQGLIYYIQYEVRVQEEEYNQKLRQKLFDHYFKDGKYHAIADVQNRITNDLNLVKDNYFEWYIIIPFYGTMFVAALVALITVHWSLFVASVVLDIFAYYVPKLVQKKMERATDNLSKQNKMYLNTLSQWFSGLEEIRRYFAGIKLFKVQEQAADKVEQAHVKQTAAQQEMIILNGVCNIVMQIILMAMTASLITKGLIIFGAIMSVQNFAANISIGLRQMLQAISYMKSSHNLMNNISADTFEINVEKKHTTAAPATIATHDLALDFPNGESLRFPDLKINQGEKILLTGDSGAGKSTLFKLILGSIKPSKGKVEFKDKKGNVVNPDMTKIGYIPQDPNLFPGTIKDNITMFNDHLDQKVAQVIDEVNFAPDIAKFKDGVNEKLNLDNLNISGGQRQKIVLARAKIHDADIILIDEGTSAIDQKATMNILQKLVKEKATIVFIAHNFNEGMRQLFDREIHLVKE